MSSPIVLNLSEIIQTAQIGINRAYIFMGFAVNMSRNADVSEFEIPDKATLSLVPKDISDGILHDYKKEFAVWAVANGLRDLNEYFEVFLDRIYSVSISVESWSVRSSGQTYADEHSPSKIKKFQKMGLSKKLNLLDRDFSISIEFAEDLLSTKRVRNCLTHRLGVVGKEDLNSEKSMCISWHVFEIYGFNQDGSEYIPNQDKLPMIFPEASPAMTRFRAKEKVFNLGERVVISPSELKEICLSYIMSIEQFQKSFLNFAQSNGVQLAKPT